VIFPSSGNPWFEKSMCEHDTVAIPIGENNQPIGMVNDPDTVLEFLAELNDTISRARWVGI
jgi:hypothetical protein